MELIGKTTINPILFYSGKIAGYFTWMVLFLLILNINLFDKISFGYNDYLSIAILIIGLIFVVLSLINLGRSTRLGLPSENTVLKTNGLYKISRNPMYLGFDLLTISSMIYTLNLFIIVLGIYSITIYHLIIVGEEQFLEKRFGLEYTNYKKKIRRYL
ncbi:isoprenylcysteine carboxylmethyltransferase family protein [bacterium]|nr:isoprenylcysteine carboxylmethyltransferase family protein [bacterium]